MIIRCVDIETSGLDPKQGAAVIEIGWTDVQIVNGKPIISRPRSILVNPGHEIPPETSGIHHIVNDDVKFALSFNEALPLISGNDLIFCAHNADFEKKFISIDNWVCTWKAAVRLWPDAPDYKQQTLRYFLKIDADKELANPPHRAGPDSYICALLLSEILNKMTVDEMIKVSSYPVLLPKFHFGKHRGHPISTIPSDYLIWVLSTDMNEDIKYTARLELKRRSSLEVAA